MPSLPLLKSASCPSPPFWAILASITVFRELLASKSQIFSERPKYKSFSSLTPSYLLKITKLLVKTSQFEVLVTTEKNIFVYKLFLSLNISDFSFFVCKIATPSFPANPLLKLRSCQAPPFFENLVGGSTPSRNGGVHYDIGYMITYAKKIDISCLKFTSATKLFFVIK